MTLLESIAQAPDDLSNYLVYSDVLIGKGDPLGELIAIQAQLAERPSDGALTAAQEALLTKHKAYFFGKLAARPEIAWEFFMGFMRKVVIMPSYSDDLDVLLRELFVLPGARLLRELVIFSREAGAEERARPALEECAPATLRSVSFPTRQVDLTEPADSIRWLHSQGDVPSLASLTNLEWLELGSSVTQLPDDMTTLRSLRRLDLQGCLVETLPEGLLAMPLLHYVSIDECILLRGYHMTRINDLLSGFARGQAPQARRELEASLMLEQDDKALTQGGVPELLAALDSNVGLVREGAMRCLARVVASAGLGDGAVVALAGKTNFDKKDLTARLAEHGAKLSAKIDARTTHVLVGPKPGGKQLRLEGRTLVLDDHLKELFAKGSSPATTSSPDVRSGLMSRDEGLTASALATLQKTALPSELVPLLFVVSQDVSLKKSRGAAKKLLATQAPTSITDAARKHLKTSLLLESLGESKRRDRLEEFCVDAKVIDPMVLAKLLLERARVGLHYVLERGAPADIHFALAALTTGHAMDLSKHELATLPAELAELTDLEELDLSENHLRAFPSALQALTKLTRLDLFKNHLTRMPKITLPALRELRLRFNRFTEFPPAIAALTTLEVLDLSSEHYVEPEARIAALPEWIGELRKLRKLGYQYNIIKEFPESFFSLENLEELNLMSCTLPAAVSPLFARLTRLRVLDLSYSDWKERVPELEALLPQCEVRGAQ